MSFVGLLISVYLKKAVERTSEIMYGHFEHIGGKAQWKCSQFFFDKKEKSSFTTNRVLK